jgi:hypothetical protein
MNRRGILRSAAAGFALTVLPRAGRSGDSGRPLITVIYDERHDDARAFAVHLRRQGVTSFPTRGDATALWYSGELQQNGGVIGGLTTWSDLVIARSCGREFGLRLVSQEPHDAGFCTTRYLNRVLALGMAPEQRDTIRPEPADRAGQLTAWLLTPRTVRATSN